MWSCSTVWQATSISHEAANLGPGPTWSGATSGFMAPMVQTAFQQLFLKLWVILGSGAGVLRVYKFR